MRRRPIPGQPLLASLALLVFLGGPAFAQAPATKPPVQLSAAYARALRDQIAQGRKLPPGIVERFGLDVREEAPAETPEPEPAAPFGTARAGAIFLGTDHQVNDRTGDTASCSGCGGRPLSQSETTIAAWGDDEVAGWNDSAGFCGFGAVQGWGISTDRGQTFTDMGEVPVFAGGGRYRGDPVHFVDTSNGEFYVLGLHEQTLNANLDLALLNGHFAGGTFVIDGNRKAIAGGADFLDKPWGAVDPATHNLYLTYSRFVGGNTPQIELIRSTDGGTSWSAPFVMHAAAQNGLVQGSRPVIGPNGELIVYWYESFTTFASPFSKHHVRISTDGGVTFGPDVVATTFIENFTTGGAGYRRGFAPTFASIAVDKSTGVHRGRIYLAWDESVNAYDAPAPSLGDVSEVEANGNFANATPFSVGQRLRGALTSSTDSLDLWRFTGTKGQTIYFRTDSSTANANFQVRIQCASDTAQFTAMRFLAFNTNPSSNFLDYTLPYTGTYYLRVFRNAAGTAAYRLLTSFDTPSPGVRARDHRDQFLCWSDDGLAWSTPVRLVDSPQGNDGIFPEVAVDGLGRVHAYWHDWRDGGPCGAESAEYMVSSGDGGGTWGANARVSDANSFWSVNACGSANQGDYQGITTEGPDVLPCWADARNGDADVFTERILRATGLTCPVSPQLAAGGTSPTLSFTLSNAGNLAATFDWRVEDDAGWITSASPAATGSAPLGVGGSMGVQATVSLPANCTPASDQVRFRVQDAAVPGAYDTCRVDLSCGVLSVPGGVNRLTLARPQPNPASGRTVFAFTLPREQPARLAIFGASGRLVRTLQSGRAAAGIHALMWDGRDDAGRRVAPGAYWARLEADGQSLRQMLMLLR